jgi:hypothetical protein
LPHWAIFVLGIYTGAAFVTLGFQTWVRLDDDSRIGSRVIPQSPSLGFLRVIKEQYCVPPIDFAAAATPPGAPLTAAAVRAGAVNRLALSLHVKCNSGRIRHRETDRDLGAMTMLDAA